MGIRGVGGARCRARQPAILRCAMTAKGQTEKNSMWANVFRVTPKSGHCSIRSACLKRANRRHRPSNQAAYSSRSECSRKNEAFPLSRPVLADQCRSPRGCLRTMRVPLRGYSSAPTFRAHWRRARSFGYRHALRSTCPRCTFFACSSFSRTARESARPPLFGCMVVSRSP
jgi:hypothetical protein